MVNIFSLAERLPLSLFILLVLSYLIWSKFLNSKKHVGNMDNLCDIIMIFLGITSIFIGVIFFFIIFSGALKLEVNLTQAIQNTFLLVSIFGILAIVLFISTYRNKKVTNKDFRDLIKGAVKSYLIIIIVFLSFYLSLLVTILKEVLYDLIVLFPFLFLSFGFLWISVQTIPNKIKWKKEIINKKFIKFVIGIALIVFLMSFLFLPIAFYEKPELIRYEFYETYRGLDQSYEVIEIQTDIKTFGILGSIVPIIPLKYGIYNLSEQKIPESKLEIFIEGKNETFRKPLAIGFDQIEKLKDSKAFNLTGVVINKKRQFIALKFDERKIKNIGVDKISLVGLIPININESEFLYETNIRQSDMCNEEKCKTTFKISNKLDKPVIIVRDHLFNLGNYNIKNTTDCEFSGITFIKLDKQKYKYHGDCNLRSCDLEIYNFIDKKYAIRGMLSLEDGVITQWDIKFSEPIDLETSISITC